MYKTLNKIRECIIKKNSKFAWDRILIRNVHNLKKYNINFLEAIECKAAIPVYPELVKNLYQTYCELYPDKAHSHSDCFFSQ